jgi:hypothetical protein
MVSATPAAKLPKAPASTGVTAAALNVIAFLASNNSSSLA